MCWPSEKASDGHYKCLCMKKLKSVPSCNFVSIFVWNVACIHYVTWKWHIFRYQKKLYAYEIVGIDWKWKKKLLSNFCVRGIIWIRNILTQVLFQKLIDGTVKLWNFVICHNCLFYTFYISLFSYLFIYFFTNLLLEWKHCWNYAENIMLFQFMDKKWNILFHE